MESKLSWIVSKVANTLFKDSLFNSNLAVLTIESLLDLILDAEVISNNAIGSLLSILDFEAALISTLHWEDLRRLFQVQSSF